MKTFEIGKTTIQLPENWDELSNLQFLHLAKLILLYQARKITHFELKVSALYNFIGFELKPPKAHKRKYLRVVLPYYIKYKLGFINISEYKKISGPAYDLYISTSDTYLYFNIIQLTEQLTFLDELDIFLSTNPLYGDQELNLPQFEVGVYINTSIKIGQYTDALEFCKAYEETGDIKMLDWAINCLSHSYDSLNEIHETLPLVSKIKFPKKYAAYLWFLSVSNYFKNHQIYSMLFSEKQTDSDSINSPANTSIYKIVSEGYGDLKTIKQLNLIEFYDLQILLLRNSISSALDAGVELPKLAEKTGLSISQINKLKW